MNSLSRICLRDSCSSPASFSSLLKWKQFFLGDGWNWDDELEVPAYLTLRSDIKFGFSRRSHYRARERRLSTITSYPGPGWTLTALRCRVHKFVIKSCSSVPQNIVLSKYQNTSVKKGIFKRAKFNQKYHNIILSWPIFSLLLLIMNPKQNRLNSLVSPTRAGTMSKCQQKPRKHPMKTGIGLSVLRTGDGGSTAGQWPWVFQEQVTYITEWLGGLTACQLPWVFKERVRHITEWLGSLTARQSHWVFKEQVYKVYNLVARQLASHLSA